MTFIGTYQGRKSLFAEKLVNKGVSASGTDGLTTLINKIDDIQHFDSGLTLYADKSIAQSSDTVNLYALLLNNGKPVSGETVLFKGIGGVRTDTYNSDPYTVYTVFGEGKIDCAAGTWRVVQGTTHIEYTTSNVFSLENTDSELIFKLNGTEIEISGLSSIDLTEPFEIWVDSTVTSNSFSLVESATTGTNGVATFQYTCSGAGLKTITAESGTLVSQPYPVLDCTYIDADAITTGKSYNVDIGSTGFALEFDVLLSANNSQGYFGIGTDNNNRILVGCIYNANQGIRVLSSGSETSHVYASTRATVGETVHIKFTYDNGAMTYNDGDETVTLTDTNVTPTKLLSSTIANTSTISNVRVYPI